MCQFLPGSQVFRQQAIACDYKELTPFPSTLVLWISWRDVLVLIPSTSEPLYMGYNCIAAVNNITTIAFLDAKENLGDQKNLYIFFSGYEDQKWVF